MVNKEPTKTYFSIIIPTLNEEKCLPLLLNDIKRQTFSQHETYVVDGNSTDRTQSIVQSYQKTFLLVSDKKNVSYQRNLGGNKAKGEYLLFMDADTRIPPFFLDGLKYHISVDHPDIFTTWISHDSSKPSDKMITTLINFTLEATKLLDFQAAYGAMIGCKRSVFSATSGFDTTIAFAEDSEFAARVAKAGYKFFIFKDPRFIYSLRRFRKEGTLPLLQKYAKLNLGIIIKGYPKSAKAYPMLGGEYYDTKKQYSRFIVSFEKVFKRLSQIEGKKRFQKILESIFTD